MATRKTSKSKAKRSKTRKTTATTKRAASRPPTTRPTGRTATHVSVPGSARPVASGAKRLRDADPKAHVEVTITLRGPELPDADALATGIAKADNVKELFSASADDAKRVADTVKAFGLKVVETSLATRSLRVAGTVAQMENAFHPGLGIYRNADQGEFRDRENDYKVPQALKGIVTSILGFGQRRVARRRSAAGAVARNALQPLTPADLEQHYVFPAGAAAGQKIGIAEFGGGYFASDLEAYCKKFARPVPSVAAVSVNKPAYTLQQILQLPPQQRKDELDSSVEVMMDIEVIAGLCASAAINVYFATFDQKGWVDLLDRVLTDKPVVLSVSWGMAEDDPSWSPAARTAINQRLAAAAALGITVSVAAGDDGAGDEETDGRCHVDFPGSSPFVLSVGGTMMASVANEQVWWESPGNRNGGGGSSGGGVSTIFPRPSWQNVRIPSLNKGSIDGRVMPDIAALAGPPFYDLIVLGKDSPNGGTSASAPLLAALVARLNGLWPATQRQRFLTPRFYLRTASGQDTGALVCTDITTGNNASNPPPKGYVAGPGYDAVSGWGTPVGTAMLAKL